MEKASNIRLINYRTLVIGASGGIGASVAKMCGLAGATLELAARDSYRLEKLAKNLQYQGIESSITECDISKPRSVRNLKENIDARGKIDILVNCAGEAEIQPLSLTDFDSWNRMFAINAGGSFLSTQAFMPDMLQKGWGRIVLLGSRAGLSGAPFLSAYAASKQAIVGFARSVARETEGKGVTINAVCPGPVDTPMMQKLISRIAQRTATPEDSMREVYMAGFKRLLFPEEVAEVIVDLCLPESETSGQVIEIDPEPCSQGSL
uniref:Short-chain dehydrogenase n=1 Tax=Candidatus Kentrum sp. SD TaxID=2126332 RepID=A0A451BMJ4_9GAMM|nr:MAG: Short-chain dehydrogenase [Candidatus Kentron sp. SD]